MAAKMILLPKRGRPVPDISWRDARGGLRLAAGPPRFRQPPVNRRTRAEMAIIAEIDDLISQLADVLRSREPNPPTD